MKFFCFFLFTKRRRFDTGFSASRCTCLPDMIWITSNDRRHCHDLRIIVRVWQGRVAVTVPFEAELHPMVAIVG